MMEMAAQEFPLTPPTTPSPLSAADETDLALRPLSAFADPLEFSRTLGSLNWSPHEELEILATYARSIGDPKVALAAIKLLDERVQRALRLSGMVQDQRFRGRTTVGNGSIEFESRSVGRSDDMRGRASSAAAKLRLSFGADNHNEQTENAPNNGPPERRETQAGMEGGRSSGPSGGGGPDGGSDPVSVAPREGPEPVIAESVSTEPAGPVSPPADSGHVPPVRIPRGGGLCRFGAIGDRPTY